MQIQAPECRLNLQGCKYECPGLGRPRYVLAIAEGGSLTAAAQLLGVHSTVLRRLTRWRRNSGAAL